MTEIVEPSFGFMLLGAFSYWDKFAANAEWWRLHSHNNDDDKGNVLVENVTKDTIDPRVGSVFWHFKSLVFGSLDLANL